MKRTVVLFDEHNIRQHLLPLTFTRPIAHLRIGILTIIEKWEKMFPGNYSVLTEEYLSEKYSPTTTQDTLFIAGHLLPTPNIITAIKALIPNSGITYNGTVLAFRGNLDQFQQSKVQELTPWPEEAENPFLIEQLYDLFMKNENALIADYHLLVDGRTDNQPLSNSNKIIGEQFFSDGTPKLFIEQGAVVEGVIFNLKKGPVYIGKDVEIMEGSTIRAPFSACEHAVVNMGTKIYGATTLGPYCKVGGELNNVIMTGYSNKAHDGFLGNAVIGEWCNIGAGTNASNLKNDYSEIRLWNYATRRFARTGLQFCGLIMGDHSKAGINCMFNTATVIGVGVNTYGSGFPRNFIPSFSEGGTAGFSDVAIEKFFSIAQKMMARRGKDLTETDRQIFQAIYEQSLNFK